MINDDAPNGFQLGLADHRFAIRAIVVVFFLVVAGVVAWELVSGQATRSTGGLAIDLLLPALWYVLVQSACKRVDAWRAALPEDPQA